MISIHDDSLRGAISAFQQLLENPNNKAAQTMARIYVQILRDHLPETLEAFLKEDR